LSIRVRIGIHAGQAIRHAGDFFGRSVVLAARIADHAEGGDILVSSLVRELICPPWRHRDPPRWAAEFKGLAGRHELFRARVAGHGHDVPRR
jgi:adenylate cyclase